MPENKIEATDRLRGERRWDEACAFREAERQRLRGEGLSRQEANGRSWQAMVERYPPIDPISELPAIGYAMMRIDKPLYRLIEQCPRQYRNQIDEAWQQMGCNLIRVSALLVRAGVVRLPE
jgi:hypothetical protein